MPKSVRALTSHPSILPHPPVAKAIDPPLLGEITALKARRDRQEKRKESSNVERLKLTLPKPQLKTLLTNPTLATVARCHFIRKDFPCFICKSEEIQCVSYNVLFIVVL